MFEPENDLERSLIRAVDDPAHRPDFLLAMLNGQTFIALDVEGQPPRAAPDGRVTIPPGTKLMLRTVRADHQEYVPFFTALSRARARRSAQSVVSQMPTRELFKHHPGRHFMLNPGFEHAQAFSSDDVNGMLAGQFDVPGAPAAESKSPAAPAPPAAAKLPELDLPEPVRLGTKPLQSQPLPGPGLPSAPSPPASPVFSPDDSFVFNLAPAQTPASVKPVAADQRPVPAAASADVEARGKPSPVKVELPEVSAVPAAARPAELESVAPKRPVPEKAATLRTAAAGALAAVRRFAAKAAGPNKLAAPASAAKPVETAQSQSAARGGGEAAPPSASSKPIAPSAALPASTKRVAAPPAPGAQIGKPDPYPVDVLLALTSAVQGVPAIEAAHLAQVQLPGHAPHFLVALGTSESWEPLMQELGPRLRKFLPAGREVEMTPLTGSMFEDYFRNETQPFFKRR